MTFRGTQTIRIWSIINVAVIVISIVYSNQSLVIIFTLLLLYAAIVTLSTSFEVSNSKLIKRTVFIKKEEIEIKEIRLIEAVTVKKAGYIYIRFGKSITEDYYILHLKNNSKIKVQAFLKHKGISLGRYLKSQYKVQFKESDKMKYIYG